MFKKILEKCLHVSDPISTMSSSVGLGLSSVAMTPSASSNGLTTGSMIETLELIQNPAEIPILPIESGDESLPTPSNSLAHDEEYDPGKI